MVMLVPPVGAAARDRTKDGLRYRNTISSDPAIESRQEMAVQPGKVEAALRSAVAGALSCRVVGCGPKSKA